MQAQSLRVGGAQAGKPALGQLEPTPVADGPWSYAPEGRIRAKGVDERPQARRLDHRVGVQEEHEFSCACSGPEVAPVGEPAVSRCPDGANREIGDRGSRVVGRRVVDDRDADPRERGEGSYAGAKRVAAVVRDDHRVHRHRCGRCSGRISEPGSVLDHVCHALSHLGATNEWGRRGFLLLGDDRAGESQAEDPRSSVRSSISQR